MVYQASPIGMALDVKYLWYQREGIRLDFGAEAFTVAISASAVRRLPQVVDAYWDDIVVAGRLKHTLLVVAMSQRQRPSIVSQLERHFQSELGRPVELKLDEAAL